MNSRSVNLWNIELVEREDSLCLSTDAVLLAAYIRTKKNAVAAELGAGSGVISLMLADKGKLGFINAVEIKKELAEISALNIEKNALSDKIKSVCADIREIIPSDFVRTSVVFANPPYMKTDSGKSSSKELYNSSRHEINGSVSDFCSAARRILKTGGALYLVYRPDRLAYLMKSLEQNGFSLKRMTLVYEDERYSPSSVLVEAKLGGGEGTYVTPPLFIRKNGEESCEIKYIYEKLNFPTVYLKP